MAPGTVGYQKGKKRKLLVKEDSGGTEDVLRRDVTNLLNRNTPTSEQDAPEAPPTVLHEIWSGAFPEIEVTVAELSSIGEGLALSPARDHVYVVPFTVPGDTVRVKVCKSLPEHRYSEADLVEVIAPSSQRDDALIRCKYFGSCSGCQFQMMSYEDQLRHKTRVVEKAYANFSGLLPEAIPPIEDTCPSPLQFGYRTKLTPHFSRPRRDAGSVEVPAIGFMQKGRRHVLDIEDCPLGTDIVRQGLKKERIHVLTNLDTFKNGATVLVRDTTIRKAKSAAPSNGPTETGDAVSRAPRLEDLAEDLVIRTEFPKYTEEKRYVSDQNARSCEYVDDYIFNTTAGAFFQNNNSVLSPVISYIRERALSRPSTEEGNGTTGPSQKIKYLLDAYCGSGLFTITLSNLFRSSLGVDISDPGIRSARANCIANCVPNANFSIADAASLFNDVPYPPEQTLLIIDPPRKGCDKNFLDQLLQFGPARIVYVSCNVHTQARDVGVLVAGGKGIRYDIESIRGFDFFPQTSHVEGVTVLNKVMA